jgi:hypothetical protein
MRAIRIIYGLPFAALLAALALNLPRMSFAAQQHALLVGCTKYEKASITPLNGPRNDVPAMARLLQARFQFADENIRQLYDWPDDASRRPTYANIAQGFADLARAVQSGDQVVIYMSGHGTQVPLPASQKDPLDAANPEPDGLDEVFLPADAQSWSDEGVRNAIRDDELGQWLDRIRDRGASVWIVFDCCHSGTMTRGQSPASSAEVARTVDPVTALGIPQSRYDFLTGEATRSAASFGQDAIDVRQLTSGRGKLVAFFAAQAFEEAPDLPRPSGAPRTPENYFGLLTYTLNETLQQQKTPLTYRELGRAIMGRYRAERGGRAPTPFFAGDLDEAVLGSDKLPPPAAINLVRTSDGIRLEAGELVGATPGSILAVLGRTEDAALGYVRVTKATPFAAQVEAVTYHDVAAPDLAKLPDSCRCKLVSQNVGDMRINLRMSGDAPAMAAVQKVLAKLPPEVAGLFELAEKAELADFELRIGGDGSIRLVAAGAAMEETSNNPRPYATYSTADSGLLAGHLERDFRKLFTWRNLWRIAGTLGGRVGTDGDIELEIAAVQGENDKSGGKLLDQTHVAGGQWLEVRVKNEGLADYWVSLLFAGADFSIVEWYAAGIRRGESFPPLRSQVDDATAGPEGFIVLAAPMRAARNQPRFNLLQQGPLGEDDSGIKRAPPPPTPFGKLLAQAASGTSTREGALDLDAASNPSIATWSWITLPPREPGRSASPAVPR